MSLLLPEVCQPQDGGTFARLLFALAFAYVAACILTPQIPKQRGRAGSDTPVLPHCSTNTRIQLRGLVLVCVCVSVWGGDEAVMERYLEAPAFSEQAVGGSVIPGGERVRGGVCVCVTSHLLLNPISKARGLNQPSPLKACQGRAHK